MTFGYIPHRLWWKNFILRIIGYPQLIRRLQAPVIMRMLEPRESEVILDAGCGGGFFTYEIARRCHTAIGIDWRVNKNLSLAASRLSNLAYVKGDIQRLPFASQKFNKILLSSVLQMVEEDTTLLRECHRLLKKDGAVVLSVPIDYIYIKRLNTVKPGLNRKFGALGKGYYGYEQLMELLKTEGFQVIEAEYAPKRLGSLVSEVCIFLWYRFRFPTFSPILFPLFYPVIYLDRLGGARAKGNELVVKARKLAHD